MTPAEALRALLAARAVLPPPLQLSRRNVLATAFSARNELGVLRPELLVFHGKKGTLPQATVAAIAAFGVDVRYELVGRPSGAGVPQEELAFAKRVLTQPGALMGGARLLINPRVGSIGTVGCLAVRNGVRGFITCRHVVIAAPAGKLFWPGPTDVLASCDEADTVKDLELSVAYGSGFPAGALRVDAAFVPLASPSIPHLSQVHGLGPLAQVASVSEPDVSLVGRHVFSVGAASGRRRGVIVGVVYQEYRTDLSALADYVIASADDAGRPMSNDGDSGSIWCLQDTLQPLGLHFRRQLLSFRQKQHMLALASNLTVALMRLEARIQ